MHKSLLLFFYEIESVQQLKIAKLDSQEYPKLSDRV